MIQNVSIVMINSTKQVLISVAICKYAQIDLKKGECLIDDYSCIGKILVDKRYETIDKNVLPNK